jgi:hypothetical protein
MSKYHQELAPSEKKIFVATGGDTDSDTASRGGDTASCALFQSCE